MSSPSGQLAELRESAPFLRQEAIDLSSFIDALTQRGGDGKSDGALVRIERELVELACRIVNAERDVSEGALTVFVRDFAKAMGFPWALPFESGAEALVAEGSLDHYASAAANGSLRGESALSQLLAASDRAGGNRFAAMYANILLRVAKLVGRADGELTETEMAEMRSFVPAIKPDRGFEWGSTEEGEPAWQPARKLAIETASNVELVLGAEAGARLGLPGVPVAEIVLGEFLELALRITAADRGSYFEQVRMIRWIFRGLIGHPWLAPYITADDVTSGLLEEAEREGSHLNPSVRRSSKVLRTLRELDQKQHSDHAPRYAKALETIGGLVAGVDREVTPLERQQIEHYVLAAGDPGAVRP